jgi:hypothetical protein
MTESESTERGAGCGPIANSLFQFRPSLQGHSKSKLETTYHKMDKALQNTIDLLAAKMLEINSQT